MDSLGRLMSDIALIQRSGGIAVSARGLSRVRVSGVVNINMLLVFWGRPVFPCYPKRISYKKPSRFATWWQLSALLCPKKKNESGLWVLLLNSCPPKHQFQVDPFQPASLQQ